MNKVIPHIMLASLFVSFATVAYADTAITTNAAVNITVTATSSRQERQENRNVQASTSREVRREIKEKLVTRAKNKLDSMTARFETVYEREMSILARITSRIGKVEAGGNSSTVSRKFAASAQAHLSEAHDAILNLMTIVDDVSSRNTASSTLSLTKDSLVTLKASTKEVQKHLRAAHADMMSAIMSLKQESAPHASSTSSVKARSTTTIEIK